MNHDAPRTLTRAGTAHGRLLPLDVLTKQALGAAQELEKQHREALPAAAAPTGAGMAPELTGRTGHAIDQRADLYALGATFYEWATGRPPFEERDPLRLVHEQLTRAPLAPNALRPDLPQAFSDIVLRLLEKEPERRYHSIGGLIHDLKRLRDELRSASCVDFTLGERDFPAQLLAPPHPIGRQREVADLRDALDAAARGEMRIVLVAGAAGVGKTSLINELKPLVAARNARFVSGKCDQFSRNEPSPTFQALRALGRLLLTEPDDVLGAQRDVILRTLGPLSSIAATVPEFKLLLGDMPELPLADPVYAVARMGWTVISLLRAIVSPQRPLVMVLDDLQWSRAPTVQLLDSMVAGTQVAGLVVVAAYRDDELEPGHPLAAALRAWRVGSCPPKLLRVTNLADTEIAELLSSMLRLPAASALPLARALAIHAGGNPYDTIELVNALRRDRLLAPHPLGWQWDATSIQRYVGEAGVLKLLEARIHRLPAAARELLQVLACVRHEVSSTLALAAWDRPAAEFDSELSVLVEDGLVTLDPGPPTVLRLAHDRVQQAACAAIADAKVLADVHVRLARRLAAHGVFERSAADQYLAGADAVTDSSECLRAAALLREGAAQARAIANHVVAEQMLDAALSLLDRSGNSEGNTPQLREGCEIDHHLTLYCLGRLDEADTVYRRIEGHQNDPLRFADPACVQVMSLHSRGRTAEAMGLGLRFLSRVGFIAPRPLERAELARGFERLRKWVEGFDPAREQARPDIGEPRTIAASKMFNRLGPLAFYAGTDVACWLVFESQTLWERHGPSPSLAATLARASLVSAALDDRRIGYLAGRHLLAFCETRGWEPARSQVRQIFAISSMHWFEPINGALYHAIKARKDLLSAGDFQSACLTYHISLISLFECNALESYAKEVTAGMEFARRTGNEQAGAMFLLDMQLKRALRGETVGIGSFDDEEFTESRFVAANESASIVLTHYHLRRAMACAVFGNATSLWEHAIAAKRMLTFESLYPSAWVYWLVGLGAAWELQQRRASRPDRDEALASALDQSLTWIANRAEDAPANFRHLHLHLCAEKSWAAGDTAAAAQTFDRTLRGLEQIERPWHRALIVERYGRFHLAQGRSRIGRQLLAEARELYLAWGATAKAAQLDGDPEARTGAGDLDTLAVLRASQALSSEHDVARLQARVEEVLGSITGATRVVLVLRDQEADQWMVRQPDGLLQALAAMPAQLPLSAFRYAERTREPLLLADALADDRFARDGYLQGVERCSLMVVPILHQGALRAMLVLENRAARGAFSTARLDAVMMIAGQLAVSLDSAQLYERLERKVAEQTQQLREAQSRLVAEARRAGMAQIATNVLHNVGNVLNSVNVSAHVLTDRIGRSRTARVADLAQLLESHAHDLGQYLNADNRGQLLPGYVRELAQALTSEREQWLAELKRLSSSVDHIKNVVAMQQSYAGTSGVLEPARLSELVDDALRIQQNALARNGVTVQRDYTPIDPVTLDRTRVMQILLNLIENARQAMSDVNGERTLSVTVRQDAQATSVTVADCGCGISAENLARIFAHGFTTKSGGHGFGLHSCAIAAREMGATLSAVSEGPGMGAAFTLRLPDLS